MSNFAFLGLDLLSVLAQPLIAASEAGVLAKPGPWRPSEWAQPAVTAITVPGTSGAATNSIVKDSSGNTLPSAPAFQGTPTQVLVFDAVLRVEHNRDLRATRHPIQTSASSPVTSITDHAYLEPARVTLEIGMSDAMASYSASLWQSAPSKSVSAYQTLVGLMKTRALVSLSTRLDSYKNMIVESIRPTDTAKTRYGLRASVTLSEIFLADATAVSSGLVGAASDSSDRPQLTGATPGGTQQAAGVGSAIAQQHTVPANQAANVPGAGNWSSSNIASLGGSF
jgi:hypothetical protein